MNTRFALDTVWPLSFSVPSSWFSQDLSVLGSFEGLSSPSRASRGPSKAWLFPTPLSPHSLRECSHACLGAPALLRLGWLPNSHLGLTSHLRSVSCLQPHPGCFPTQQSIHSYPSITSSSGPSKSELTAYIPHWLPFQPLSSIPNMFCFLTEPILSFLGSPPRGTGEKFINPPPFTATSYPISLTIAFQFLCFFNSKNRGSDR